MADVSYWQWGWREGNSSHLKMRVNHLKKLCTLTLMWQVNLIQWHLQCPFNGLKCLHFHFATPCIRFFRGPIPFLLVRGSPSDAKLCNTKAPESVFEFWEVGHFLWGAKFISNSAHFFRDLNAAEECFYWRKFFFFFIWKCKKWGGMCTKAKRLYCSPTSNCKFRENVAYEVYGIMRSNKFTPPGFFIFFIKSKSTAEQFLTSIRTVERLAYLYQSGYLWLHWTVQPF